MSIIDKIVYLCKICKELTIIMPKKYVLTYWKSISIALIIFVLSTVSFSTTNTAPKIKNFDKLVHCLMYLGLGFTLFYDYSKDTFTKVGKFIFILMVLAIFYGGLIEIIQEYFTTRRTAEWLDWLADIVGVFLGFGAGFLLLKKAK